MNAVNPHSSSVLAELQQRFRASGDPFPILAGRTEVVDKAVCSAFTEHLAGTFRTGMAVLAVGGFGRSELFPHSDVDVLLLVERTPQDERSRDALSGFLRTLWDAGVRLSHSVHTIEECCSYHSTNLELSIGLLDQRFLCGDLDLHHKLAARLPKFFTAERRTLVRHLIRQARERHEKFHNTVYHLEPNIKESPGGLRDLHLIGWLAKLQDGGRTMPDWLGELRDEERCACTIRCYLHLEAGRDQNLLNFDAQEEIVKQPFVAKDGKPVTVESWMRTYFLNARRIYKAALQAVDTSETLAPSGLLGSLREWRSKLTTAEIAVYKERLYLRSPQDLENDPDLAMRLIRFIAEHNLPPAAETERRVAQALPALTGYFATSRPVWPALREIFELPNAIGALRAMHDTGLMGALIPEWRSIEGLVIRDFYHRYTVDEHTLVVAESLLALRRNTDPARERYAQLLTEVEAQPLLVLAILLHDIGKSTEGPMHADASLLQARTVIERIQVPAADRPLVLFLVEQHLLLSSVMNSRDLNDPSTAQYLAAKAGTVENLRYLTLLTYSDISGVNPTAMTPWRLEQLWRVYVIGLRELTRALDADRIHMELDAPAHDFLEGFPSRYLRTHTKEDVEAHLKLEQKSRERGVATELKRNGGVWRMTVVTDDRPRLFASVVGALSGFGMDILKAEAFSNQRSEVLDTFTFADPGRALELNPSEIERLRDTVEKAAMGRLDVSALLASRRPPVTPRKREKLRPTIYFDSEVSDHATLVEIVAEDRIGLLYDFATVFADLQCNIEVVLIDTEARKALDVFYLTKQGRKLTENEQFVLEDRLRGVCMG